MVSLDFAVDPAAQGQGSGRKLLEPTIAEADRVFATCYLETFTPEIFPFTSVSALLSRCDLRSGHCSDHVLMIRHPRAPKENGVP